METGDIIVIDKVEDDSYGGKDFKKVTDKAGNSFNVKYGQGGKLKDKWHLLGEGIAIKLTVDRYNNKPFVKDFEVVKDVFVKQAAEKVQGQIKVDRNDSIESQVAFKGMIELIVAGKLGMEATTATIEWGMSRINLPSVIIDKVEEAKSETIETNKDNQETQSELTNRQDSGEATEPKTAGQLFTWIRTKDKDIKVPRLWLQTEFGLAGNDVITNEKVKELYAEIKAKMGW